MIIGNSPQFLVFRWQIHSIHCSMISSLLGRAETIFGVAFARLDWQGPVQRDELHTI